MERIERVNTLRALFQMAFKFGRTARVEFVIEVGVEQRFGAIATHVDAFSERDI